MCDEINAVCPDSVCLCTGGIRYTATKSEVGETARADESILENRTCPLKHTSGCLIKGSDE